MVHDVRSCPFSHFFEVTPVELLAAGIYNKLAYEWRDELDYQPVCVALIARALGASPRKDWLRILEKQQDTWLNFGSRSARFSAYRTCTAAS